MMFRNPGWVTARMQLPEIFPEIILQSRNFPGHFPGKYLLRFTCPIVHYLVKSCLNMVFSAC